MRMDENTVQDADNTWNILIRDVHVVGQYLGQNQERSTYRKPHINYAENNCHSSFLSNTKEMCQDIFEYRWNITEDQRVFHSEVISQSFQDNIINS